MALPEKPISEHRVDTRLRLLKPLGLVRPTAWTAAQSQMRLPAGGHQFVDEELPERPFVLGPGYVLLNLIAGGPLKFSETDILTLGRHFLSATPFAVAIMAEPAEHKLVSEICLVLGSERIALLETLSPLELAGLLERTVLLVTMEDAAAHLAAAMDAPAVVIWPDPATFAHTHPRSRRHVFVQVEPGDHGMPVERVWQGVETLLASKKYDIERQWPDLLQLPPSSELS